MDKLEKVIHSLERCTCHVPDACRDCAYDDKPAPDCWQSLERDAIELLKEQLPRVLTLEEATSEDECWFEFGPANIGRYADCYLHDNPERTRVYFTGKATMSLFDNADYNKTWRCWTARPTDEQRKAVKWNDEA